ncbi:CDP-alcohol phosphatidyltransferase family protein [Proteobacteria bacterium 005FR1]|nr:CDP-alcohol phosphatidyltransferase family protein [Proteobacteria bacterium 005FR1]
MTNRIVKNLPNAITTLRLFLALPICLFILQEKFELVLGIAVFAGASDLVDGWWARKMGAQSRYGSVIDPISDKALLIGTYVSLALVNAIPMTVAVVVVARDLVIVAGALAYHLLIGRYEMAPTVWGKLSTLVQIAFALMVLTQQVYPIFPVSFFEVGVLLVIGLAFISGGNYVGVWGRKAWEEFRKR